MMNQSDHESILEQAIEFAMKAHHGMNRKGHHIPYILHPLEAAAIAASLTEDEEILAAAVLHDVVEDTPVTLEMIRSTFNERIAALVSSETEDKMVHLPPEASWQARKTATIEHIRKASREEKILVLSDKLSNIRACRRDQLIEKDHLWEKFHEKRKEKHEWYYRSILDALSDLKEEFAYQEFSLLVNEVFKNQED